MTTQTAQQPATNTGTPNYHFILTVQRQNGIASCRSDVIDIPAGMSRRDVLQALFARLFPGDQQMVVLFFDLQPNQI
jgi:hypothetical protein